MLVARLRGNQTGVENRTWKSDQVIDTVTDPLLVSFPFFVVCVYGGRRRLTDAHSTYSSSSASSRTSPYVPPLHTLTQSKSVGTNAMVLCAQNGGISNFSTLIIKGLNFDTLQTSLLTIPQGFFTSIWILAGALMNQYMPRNSRTWVCMCVRLLLSALLKGHCSFIRGGTWCVMVLTRAHRAMMLPSIGGTLGLLLAPQDARIGRLFAYYMTGSHSGPFVIGLSLWSSNIGGQ